MAEDFRTHAMEQQALIDRLLGARRRRQLSAKPVAGQPTRTQWTRDARDPEFEKNLSIFRHLIGGAIGISERRPPGLDFDTLRALITLPGDLPLTLKVLLGRRFALEQELVASRDVTYLRSRAADLYDERPGTSTTWRDLYDEPPPLLADTVRPAHKWHADAWSEQRVEDPVERTARMLARLVAVKEAQDLPLRARRELKQQALWVVLPALAVATALFAATIAVVDGFRDGEVLLAAAAGACGAALGGLLKLRDEVTLGAQVREFVPFFVGQLVVGAAAGLLAYVTVRSGLIDLGSEAVAIGALGFVVGFSEAAFLGLVGRIAGTVAGAKAEAKTPPA